MPLAGMYPNFARDLRQATPPPSLANILEMALAITLQVEGEVSDVEDERGDDVNQQDS